MIKMNYLAACAAALALALAGCQSAQTQNTVAGSCPVNQQMQQTTLYFGLSKPDGGEVTPGQWRAFVDHEVTPRFRAGLTVTEARGQWLGDDGRVVRENSRALMLIHEARQDADIEALRRIYRARFHQESVMRVDTPACVRF